MPQRASVSGTEALRANAVPPKADVGRAMVMLGQKGLTQSLEANPRAFVEQIRVGSCWSVHPGFQLKYLLPSREVLLPRLFSIG